MAAINIESNVPLCGQNKAINKTWTDTEVNILEASHTWRIRNFSYCLKETGQALESEGFSSGGKDDDKWYLELYPHGDREDNKDHLSFYVRLKSCNKESVPATLKYTIHSDEIETFESLQTKNLGYSKFMERDLLLASAKEFLPNDVLTLSCEIVMNESITKISGEDIIPKLNDPSRSLLENLGHILNTETFSDVTLVAGQREFQAHKLILTAHSLVFSAMFKDKMVKQNQIRVDVIYYE